MAEIGAVTDPVRETGLRAAGLIAATTVAALLVRGAGGRGNGQLAVRRGTRRHGRRGEANAMTIGATRPPAAPS